MAIINATINMRNGEYADFDPFKQIKGELAVVTSGDPSVADGKGVYATFAPGNVKRLCTYQEVSGLVTLAEGYAESAEENAQIAETQATNAGNSATSANASATRAQEYKEYVEDVVDALPPIMTIDFETGELLADGGLLILSINDSTGNLEYVRHDGYHTVEYKEFIPHLINVIQDQQKDIDMLKKQLRKRRTNKG